MDGLNHAPAALVHGSKDLEKIPVIFYAQKDGSYGLNHAPAALVHGSKDLEIIPVIFYAQNDGSYGLNHSPADLVHGKTSKSFLQIFCHDATNLFTVYCTVYSVHFTSSVRAQFHFGGVFDCKHGTAADPT